MGVRRRGAVCAMGVAAAACAAAAQPTGFPGPTAYAVETRWQVNTELGSDGASRVVLTLQGRADLGGWAHGDGTINGGLAVRQGNFGLLSLGYGAEGAAQPATIRSSEGTSLERGAWLTSNAEDEAVTVYGASPGVWDPARGAYLNGMRFSGSEPIADTPTGNAGPLPQFNGRFAAPNVLTEINLLRTDVGTNFVPARNLTDPSGGARWNDLYRVVLVTDAPVVLGGDDVVVDFSGYFRAATYAVNWTAGQWQLGSPAHGPDAPQPAGSATIGFSFVGGGVPGPGGACVVALAGLAGLRRRRR